MIQLRDDYANAYNYIGYMLAERGIRLDEALEAIQKALELDPENGAYIDSLGWVYFQKGMLDDAIRELERAVQLLDSDPIIHEHLGDAYTKKGDIEKAIEHYEKSLEREFKEDVQKKLDELKLRMKSVKNHISPQSQTDTEKSQ